MSNYSYFRDKFLGIQDFVNNGGDEMERLAINIYPQLIEELLSTIKKLESENLFLGEKPIEQEFDEIVGTVYKWTKEPNDKFISEENIVQELDEKMLQALSLLGNVQITNSKQVEYLSQFMDSDIDLDEYDYFFEYYE